jgi:hypothetical protein
MIIEEVLKERGYFQEIPRQINKTTQEISNNAIELQKNVFEIYINCHMPSSLIELLRIIINHLNTDKDITTISGVGGIVSIRGLYSGLSELLKIMNLNEIISCHHPHNLNLRMQEILLLD